MLVESQMQVCPTSCPHHTSIRDLTSFRSICSTAAGRAAAVQQAIFGQPIGELEAYKPWCAQSHEAQNMHHVWKEKRNISSVIIHITAVCSENPGSAETKRPSRLKNKCWNNLVGGAQSARLCRRHSRGELNTTDISATGRLDIR